MSGASIVVAGYMLRLPLAGNMLAYFQYVLGLRRLGHHVVYLEESGWGSSSYDPATCQWSDHPGRGLALARDLVERHCPGTPVVFVDRDNGTVDGASASQLRDWLRGCDLLLNLGGVCALPDFELCRARALVDMDPMFSQAGHFAFPTLADHQVRFSYGVNIGTPGCGVPTLGLSWLPAVPPVVLDLWSLPAAAPGAPLTTVSNWAGYGSAVHEGREYGHKDVEFLRLLGLPGIVGRPLELALYGAPEEVAGLFRENGWRVRDGAEVSTDVDSYRGYIGASAGELSAAKHAYVASRSGWFSDRSACYLAAGRPVIVQDTGLADVLPLGHGVHAFSDVAGAAAAIGRVDAEPEAQARAAREVAEGHFSSDVVLPALLRAATASPSAARAVELG